MWVAPLDRPWKGSTAIGFLFFTFWSWIFDKNSKFYISRFMQKWIQPPACLDQGLHGLKPGSFPPNHSPKLWERHQLFFGLRLMSKEFQHSANQTKIEQHLVHFLHQIKVRQPIGRRILCKPWSEQAGGWIYFWMKQMNYSNSGMYSSRPTLWYHSHVDPIWPDDTFKDTYCNSHKLFKSQGSGMNSCKKYISVPHWCIRLEFPGILSF